MGELIGYVIFSPDCGRDKLGVFHCVCGKCRPLYSERGNDRHNGGDDCGDRGDSRDNSRDDETP